MKLTPVPLLSVCGISTSLSYFLRTNISFYHDAFIINSKNVNSGELVNSEALKLCVLCVFEPFRFVQNRFWFLCLMLGIYFNPTREAKI